MNSDIYIPKAERYATMGYRRAGRSGVMLPEISLGFWHNFGKNHDEASGLEIVHYAFDHGICHFDLANNYGPPNGAAEERFGRYMKQSMHTHRDEMFIATKAGHPMWAGPYGDWGSRKSLIASLDQSLRRMNLDYVDIYYTHRYDPGTPLEETMQALVDIVRSGKALYIGLSKYPVEIAHDAYAYLEAHDVHCILYQGRYNMLTRQPEEAIIPQAHNNGTGFVAFSPLAQGLLTDRYLQGIPEGSRMATSNFLQSEVLTEELLDKLCQLNIIANNRGQTLAEMALAWILRDERITSVIIGASSVEQLKRNLHARENLTFTAEEIEKIDHLL
ncbi:MAG: L-glyceraldehyde 3-phosphate reductase [Bacteroidales bacterium]|nr:L-glyceraldehyde 3-phosphate reductase [Bacteroidales bacterium]